MKVQFITNVGTRDAQAHGIDHTKATEGSIHDFPDDKARELINPSVVNGEQRPPLAREWTQEAEDSQRRSLSQPATETVPTPATFQQHPHRPTEKKPEK